MALSHAPLGSMRPFGSSSPEGASELPNQNQMTGPDRGLAHTLRDSMRPRPFFAPEGAPSDHDRSLAAGLDRWPRPVRYVAPCGLDPTSLPKVLRAIVTEAS